MLIDWVTSSVFNEIAALLVLAAIIGVGLLLRQPLIVSIIVGVIAGPAMLGIARSNEPIELFAQLGIAIQFYAGNSSRKARPSCSPAT